VSSFLLAVPSEVLFRINLNVLYIYIYMPPLEEQHIFQIDMEKRVRTGFKGLESLFCSMVTRMSLACLVHYTLLHTYCTFT
jgi:hypothetical protein